jgi:hypothetical protein
MASFHSGPSHLSSDSSGTHSGEQERLVEEEVLIKKDHALRGRYVPLEIGLIYRRSQPQLIPLIRVASSAGQSGRG